MISEKQVYIEKLKQEIQRLYHCEAAYRRSVSVHELLEDDTVWDGTVEMFWLYGHPDASRCYAWSAFSKEGNVENPHIILEIPPVIGAATAVRTACAGKQ